MPASFGSQLAHQARLWYAQIKNPRLAPRAERIQKAFGALVAEKLDERDRIVLGRYMTLLCKMNFDTGLRCGLTARLMPPEDQ